MRSGAHCRPAGPLKFALVRVANTLLGLFIYAQGGEDHVCQP